MTSSAVPSANALQILASPAARVGSKVAVRHADRALTYEQLLGLTAQAAAGLRAMGVRRGNRVLHFAQNSPEHVALYFACAWIGAVYLPVHASFRDSEIAYIAEVTQRTGAPVAVVGDGLLSTFLGFYETVGSLPPLVVALGEGQAAERDDPAHGPMVRGPHALFGHGGDPGPVEVVTGDDPLLLMFTSGSSSRPKPVLTSHRAEIWNATAYVQMWDYRESDTHMLALPLSWASGLGTITLPMIALGATVVILPRFNPVLALEAIKRDGVTLLKGPSTMYALLLSALDQHGGDLCSIRRMYVGGEARNERVIREIEARQGGRVYESWGGTETRPVTAVDPRDAEAPYGTVGRVLDGVELRIVNRDGLDVGANEPGEAWVRTPGQMLCYDGEPELTAERVTADGWFKTGDLVTRDERGYVFVVGRLSSMIIRGGSNIAPAEVERALGALPAVAEAAVFGLPDAVKGESVIAAVVLKPGFEASPEGLIDQVATHLAAYKVPQRVVIVESMATGSAGKRDPQAIRDQVASMLAS